MRIQNKSASMYVDMRLVWIVFLRQRRSLEEDKCRNVTSNQKTVAFNPHKISRASYMKGVSTKSLIYKLNF